MWQEELTEQFDALLRPSRGMRFVVVYMRVLIAVMALGSLIVLRVAYVTGDWIIAVPVPLMFVLLFALLNTIKGVRARYPADRRAAMTIFWMCGALGFAFGVGRVAVAVRDYDADLMWQSLGAVLFGVLSVVFSACAVFCAIYLEDAEGADHYFGREDKQNPDSRRNLRSGSPYRNRPFGPYYR